MPRIKRASTSNLNTPAKRPRERDTDLNAAFEEEEEASRKKKVRWDGATPESDEETEPQETEESSEEDTRAEKVCTYLPLLYWGDRSAHKLVWFSDLFGCDVRGVRRLVPEHGCMRCLMDVSLALIYWSEVVGWDVHITTRSSATSMFWRIRRRTCILT